VGPGINDDHIGHIGVFQPSATAAPLFYTKGPPSTYPGFVPLRTGSSFADVKVVLRKTETMSPWPCEIRCFNVDKLVRFVCEFSQPTESDYVDAGVSKAKGWQGQLRCYQGLAPEIVLRGFVSARRGGRL
jgi:hypothetical protein